MKKMFSALSVLSVCVLSAQIFNPTSTVSTTTNPSTNNVGIGTNAPTEKLTVSGAHIGSVIRLHSTGDGATNPANLFFWASEPGETYTGVGIGNNVKNYSAGQSFVLVNPTTGGSYIRLLDNEINFNLISNSGIKKKVINITGNGNVGIGTSNTPEYKLQVNDGMMTSKIEDPIVSPTNKVGYLINQLGQNIFEMSFARDNLGVVNMKTLLDNPIIIGTNDVERMRITATGNIGMGIANPTEKLDVLGNIRIGGTHSTEGVNALSIRYQNGSLNNWGSLRSSSATFMSFGVKADNTVSDGWLSSDPSMNSRLAMTIGNGGFLFLSANQQATAINSPVTMTEVMKITPFGNAALQGKFEAKEIKVTLTPTADFVFENDYNLPKLEDVEKHIKEKKHLPEIASAKEMEKEGVNVGEFQIKLLQKIEELTLYTIEQNKLLKEQGEVIKKQQMRIEKLEANNK